jgi:hypothetical protein
MKHTSHDRTVHYVYRLVHDATGDFYIGVRSSDLPAAQDRSYFGSGRWPQHAKFHGLVLRKDVLGTFQTRTLAEEVEGLLIDMSLMDRRCRNSVKTASAAFKTKHCRYHGHNKRLIFEGALA